MISRPKLLLLLCSLAFAGGCDSGPASTADPVLQTGFWQVRITLPGGDIDSGVEISRHAQGGFVASLVNGQERIPIDEVRFADGELVLRFPAFNNEIRARLIDGELRGELVLVKRHGKTQSMPFVATHGAARQEPAAGASENDLSGRWAVRFEEPDGSITPAIGEFSQRGARLFGTFMTPNGDFRYLAGHLRNGELKLSTFDGANAFVLRGNVDGNRITDGRFWSGTGWLQPWSAVRDAAASLPDAYGRTFLKPGHERFTFAFPNLEGETVSLDDPRFAGKVVVVTLGGSWCPNCHDEARFLVPLYDKYRDRGFEVVALMFEHLDDKELAAAQVRRFRDKFRIGYELLLAGTSSKSDAAEALPSLNAVLAFPTTIIIDRDGHIRRILTGFSGPATGDHHRKLTAELGALFEELLAEQPSPGLPAPGDA